MDNPVELALNFVRRFAMVAERLAQQDIVVRSLRCDWSSFGSWSVEASRGDGERKRSAAIQRKAFDEPGPEAVRVSWDGKDRQLAMTTIRTTAAYVIGPAERLDTQQCDSFEAALALAEEWLSDRLRSSRRP